jgi:hypothetical protein
LFRNVFHQFGARPARVCFPNEIAPGMDELIATIHTPAYNPRIFPNFRSNDKQNAVFAPAIHKNEKASG